MNYTGGSSANLTTGSRIAPQLNTVRYFEIPDGPENCYNVSVPNGHYLIRLYFSFGDKDNGGREPEFEVSIEGTLVYSLTRRWSIVVDDEYADSLVHISDGAATVCFHSSGHGNPVIPSIEILQINDNAYSMGTSSTSNVIMKTVKRVTAGAEKSGYGASLHADPWGGDRYWATDQTLFTPGSAVSVQRTMLNISKCNNPPNVYPQAIYHSATSTGLMNKLSYTIPVQANQNYSIWLHFAEIEPDITMPNERVFNVMADGAPLFQAVDIVKMAGDPCIPQVHAWYGVNCEFDAAVGTWFISGLLKGSTGDSIMALQRLQSLNLSNNVLTGVIPESLGNVSSLVTLDLSHNRLNGSIPASLGLLPKLQELLLNDNQLIGEVPPSLEVFPIRGGVLNLANNDGLCGLGLRSCTTMSHGQRTGVTIGVILGFMVLLIGGYLCCKRRMNMIRGAQRLPRDAPYAKARTTFVRDVQMARNTLANHFSRPAPSHSETTPWNPQ